MCMRWTSRCVTSLVNETTNSNVLGPQGGGGHDGSGSGGDVKGGGEETRTDLDPRHPHTLSSDNNTRERKHAGGTREEKKERDRSPESETVMVVLVQRPSVLVTWKDDLRDGTIILWDPGPKRDTCCTCQ